MREIKFRAWDKENKKMVEVDLLGRNVLHIKNSEWENIEDFEVMQYTGLKDKDGNEIYEGDYLYVGGYNYDEPEGEWEGIVTISAIGTGIDGISCDTGDKGFFYLNDIGGEYRTIYEVVGNIYEQPELLKNLEEGE